MAIKKIAFILTSLLIISCEDAINTSLETINTDLLVVEGLLTNEKIAHKIKLSLPHSEINGDPIPAAGAVVSILEGRPGGEDFEADTTFLLTEIPLNSGEYFSDPFRAVFGRIYVLAINYEGNLYSAFDASESGEPLPDLDLDTTIVNEEFLLFQLGFNESGDNANFITHDLSWANTSFCQPDTLCEGKIVFYDLKTFDVHDIYKPEKTDFLFPVNTTIIRKKYSVNERYRSFLRSVLSETEWRGGLFDIQRANASTNLSEGAIGYFAVSTVVTDTTIVIE